MTNHTPRTPPLRSGTTAKSPPAGIADAGPGVPPDQQPTRQPRMPPTETGEPGEPTDPTEASGRDVPVSATARAFWDEAVHLQPIPRADIGTHSTDLPLPAAHTIIELPPPVNSRPANQHRDLTFSEVLARRRSSRAIGTLSLDELATVLSSTFTLQGFARADDGAVRRFRPIPSAGARHPLIPLLFVNDVHGMASGLWRYDTDGNRALHVVRPRDAADDLQALGSSFLEAGQLTSPPPAVVVLAARFDATLARYPAGASLVWRDAGAALAVLHLAATSIGLTSCILGTTGVVSPRLLDRSGVTGSLVGDVGALVLGRPADG